MARKSRATRTRNKRRARRAVQKRRAGKARAASRARTPAKKSAQRPANSPARPSKERASGREPYFVTTAISYPNGEPHIGHAYEAIASDAIARFMRLDGRDVFFLTGVDEHGLKMAQTAAKEGISPRQLADRNSPKFREMCDRLNISYDRFIRTTEPAHYSSSQAIWRKMAA